MQKKTQGDLKDLEAGRIQWAREIADELNRRRHPSPRGVSGIRWDDVYSVVRLMKTGRIVEAINGYGEPFVSAVSDEMPERLTCD